MAKRAAAEAAKMGLRRGLRKGRKSFYCQATGKILTGVQTLTGAVFMSLTYLTPLESSNKLASQLGSSQ